MASLPRILIVDDEKRFRTTMSKFLAASGLTAATAGSGREALEELRRTSYDVIILDVRMPEMSGVEALKEIKKIDPEVEVIIMTGYASVDTAKEIMTRGAYDYMLKPCAVEELMEKIDAAYERKLSRKKLAVQSTPGGEKPQE
jgi:DNA-binding NtrC family response regulator